VKTYKREVSMALLAYVMALGVASVWSAGAFEVLKLFIPPVFLFAAGAFGMDAYAKQVKGG